MTEENHYVVSADGLEPSTHALKQYPTTRTQCSSGEQEWRHGSMFTQSRSDAALHAQTLGHSCYLPLERLDRGGFVGIFVEEGFDTDGDPAVTFGTQDKTTRRNPTKFPFPCSIEPNSQQRTNRALPRLSESGEGPRRALGGCLQVRFDAVFDVD